MTWPSEFGHVAKVIRTTHQLIKLVSYDYSQKGLQLPPYHKRSLPPAKDGCYLCIEGSKY